MKTDNPHSFLPQRGFTMVEMMVALALGVIVLFGISQIFIKTKRAATFQEEMARMQENSRYAIQLLNQEIRNAGYLGCRHASSMDAAYIDTNGTYLDNVALAVEGYEAIGTAPGDSFTLASATSNWNGGNGTLPALASTPLNGQPLSPGSDIIIIRYANGPGLTLASDKQDNSEIRVNNIAVEPNSCDSGTSSKFSGFCTGDPAIISDCERARSFNIGTLALDSSGILTITDNSGTNWVAENNSSLPFTMADSSLFEVRTVAFFIRNNAAGIPALYRKIGNGNAQELVEGVENMQITYGEDSNNDGVPEQYKTADNVTSFANVVSAHVSLMLRTIRETARRTAAAQTLPILSAEVTTASDRHHRHIFTATIQLRNPDE